jgi:uncharacterized protein (DUF2345 family)
MRIAFMLAFSFCLRYGRRDTIELKTGATAKRALTPTPTRVEARDHWHLLVARSVRVQACVDLSVFARA